jgi:hypothetical protein
MTIKPTVFRKWALGLLIFIWALCAGTPKVWATHIRAGEITAKSDTALVNPNPLKYYFKLITYADPSKGIDDNQATLFFGDGTDQTSPKQLPELVIIPNVLVRRVFYFTHIFPAAGRNYQVVYNEQNRFSGIINISNPSMNSFYVSTTISINPQIGINHSPQFSVPPLDIAAQGQVFIHFPGAYDLDQDSLSYKLRVPQRNSAGIGPPVGAPVFGYKFPDDPSFGGTTVNDPVTNTPAGLPAKFTLNERTGEIRWNVPNTTGEYNIAFVVEEWKLVPNRTAIKIGEVTRDMQITVRPTLNKTPRLIIPKDTCVIAGNLLQVQVSAIDGNTPPDPFTFNSYSGIITPATI